MPNYRNPDGSCQASIDDMCRCQTARDCFTVPRPAPPAPLPLVDLLSEAMAEELHRRLGHIVVDWRRCGECPCYVLAAQPTDLGLGA